MDESTEKLISKARPTYDRHERHGLGSMLQTCMHICMPDTCDVPCHPAVRHRCDTALAKTAGIKFDLLVHCNQAAGVSQAATHQLRRKEEGRGLARVAEAQLLHQREQRHEEGTCDAEHMVRLEDQSSSAAGLCGKFACNMHAGAAAPGGAAALQRKVIFLPCPKVMGSGSCWTRSAVWICGMTICCVIHLQPAATRSARP